jgi:hypothetical protein
MKRMLTSISVIVAALAMLLLPAAAAGPYDGSWFVDAPQAGGAGTNENTSGCAPVRIPFTVTDNKISGKLQRAAYGTGRVEASEAGTPFTGTVAADGSITASWQNYKATGKLSGDKAELRWKGECGDRVATGGRAK